jgi:hypothetical protein
MPKFFFIAAFLDYIRLNLAKVVLVLVETCQKMKDIWIYFLSKFNGIVVIVE